MDLNIKVKIDSPDILNGLLALAVEISKAAIVPKEAVQAIKDDKKEEILKPITLEDVRLKLSGLSQNGKQQEVKALIKKFGSNKLTDISKEKYAELLKAAEEI